MKKILSLLLAAMMIVSFCGCFDDGEADNVRGEILGGGSSVEEISSELETSSEEAQPEFSMGKATSNTYKNDFLGLNCTLPEEWVFYTDKQILELNNVVGEVIDEKTASQLENANIIYDMYASIEAEGSSININLEKFSAVQMVTLDIKQVLEAQIDTIKSAYQNMGYTDTQVTYQKVKVDGKEFDALKITAKIQGIDFYSVSFAFKKGNYLANVAIGSLQTDKTDTYMGYFDVK